jgi:hypothetical protein
MVGTTGAQSRRSVHQTQWAAQFAVASELCKRGYEVALTMGNHPTTDIMVSSPGGARFGVDVKGAYKRNFWLVKQKPSRSDIYYVFAFVPDGGQNRFFILSQSQVSEAIQIEFERARLAAKAKGRSDEKVEDWPGVQWSIAERFENRWDLLPT